VPKDVRLEEQSIAAAAAKIVSRHGRKSLQIVAKYSEVATAIGDPSAVQTWQTVTSAVERLLVENGRLTGTVTQRQRQPLQHFRRAE